ncbi:MAG: aconitate hydratase [Spirochaetaceae bacterium]|jgi:aconitate hydratase|nr:aconitate hydratase [Spirochaetaceae bacterium]
MKIESTPELVESLYNNLKKNLSVVRKRLNRRLTLAEKILFGHLRDAENQDLTRGESFLLLQPDRVAMQDATAQMALLQFMLAGKDESAVAATVHCDHLIRGYQGENSDLKNALNENKEVYNFLSSTCSRYGIGFWKPGAGIIHQIVLENYAFPGGLMIGTDSHTPNAGGLGMVACGVGGADASDVMAGLAWEVKNPGILGVKLTGKLQGWTSPKDVIIRLLDILTVKGGTNRVIEYFGEGCESISCTGKATITNMGAELGATCSIFPYDIKMSQYLKATNREEIDNICQTYGDLLQADVEVQENPEEYYDQVIEINLSTLEPHITGPHSPDAATPLSQVKKKAVKDGWPVKLSSALIGSCTNSSYEDIDRAASIIKEAKKLGIKFKMPYYVSPGSTLVKDTIEKEGQLQILKDAGAVVLSNSCGPCIGQWQREDVTKGTKNSIINSFNRNFRARNDGNPETLSFIASPETVTLLALTGRLDFNPLTDKVKNDKGEEVFLSFPKGDELPPGGFVQDTSVYQKPQGKNVEVKVNPQSDRIEILEPFAAWEGEDLEDMLLLCKARGKCTTDHISPAGPWLRFRGHLSNISDNMLTGAVNDFTGENGKVADVLTGETGLTFAQAAKNYQAAQKDWIIVGDQNYGEGSSREHAAMSPRKLGCRAVITRSFARIHETNLKKQGILALTFANPQDYDKISQKGKFAIRGLKEWTPSKDLTLVITQKDSTLEIPLKHSYNQEQIEWFKEGSALNCLRKS